ncbi:hypothetical protein EIKCOROL_02153 [Eikenella corrodens ATCC 23834]|uniref:Uncharacterized protein n=1 Tax=Eikenella corrodens ATCC 23834 TaxID=546274 RepID=C0DXP2_EIKCO|nr:hypothetical protein EIKCOROL_02153 [Eikenella corrodens ATCC 23834]
MRDEKRYCNLKPAGCLPCCYPVWVSQQLVFLQRPRFSSAETRPPPEISFSLYRLSGSPPFALFRTRLPLTNFLYLPANSSFGINRKNYCPLSSRC